ncbi:uncharacterized protein [Spinacia oleracea]|uniref:Reverse transcriptase zinc-binding domain-containing protein n=1 Tax=Spinacia oleracea TaxID=3562 RepID=A0ABM3RPE7_SPIOL|nr:uncharacterized protein LOC130471397 [Spinacia oleracea]
MKPPPQASWVIRKIFGAISWLEEVCNHNNYLNSETFVIKQIYKEIKGVDSRVPWRKILCNTPAPPKCIFICWLAILGRLATCDRLAKFGVQCSDLCGLCGSVGETLNHLFFDCSVSAAVWGKILVWLGYSRKPENWQQETQRVNSEFNKNNATHQLYRLALVISVYHLWKERNNRVFRKNLQTVEGLVRKIQYMSQWTNTRCNFWNLEINTSDDLRHIADK